MNTHDSASGTECKKLLRYSIQVAEIEKRSYEHLSCIYNNASESPIDWTSRDAYGLNLLELCAAYGSLDSLLAIANSTEQSTIDQGLLEWSIKTYDWNPIFAKIVSLNENFNNLLV